MINRDPYTHSVAVVRTPLATAKLKYNIKISGDRALSWI